MTTRIQIWHLRSGNAICVISNLDGTWRVPPFMLYADYFKQRDKVTT